MVTVDKTRNLPLNAIYYSLNDDKFKPTVLRSFLYLKFYYPDRFTANKLFFKEWAGFMECNVKTAKTHFEAFKAANYVGFDHKHGLAYVRSIYSVGSTNFTINNKLSIKVSLTDLKHFTPFLVAAVIAHRVRIYRAKQRAKQKTGTDLMSDGSRQVLVARGKILLGYAPLAITYLSKVMTRSPAWIEKYKKQAIKLGYIIAKSDRIDTTIKWEARNFVVEDNKLGQTRKAKDMLMYVSTDFLTSNLQTVKRKKGV
jgi:hypothetical protein